MAPTATLETPIYRAFALVAIVVTLVAATPIGAVALFRLFAGFGYVSPRWLQLHGHLQIFGFAGVLIMGVGPHLILRFTHCPIRRPAFAAWTLGLIVLGILGRMAATMADGPAAGLRLASGIAETLAFVIFAVWVTAGVWAAEPRFPSDWLMVTGAWWFVAALAMEPVGLAWATATGQDPAVATPGPGLYAMGLYGGILGWVLGVAMRVVPMFIPGRRVGRMGGPVLAGLNGGVILALAAEVWPLGSRPAEVLSALADLGIVIALIGTGVAAGVWRPEARLAIPLRPDRMEARFFRLAFVCAGLAAVGLFAGAVLTLAGAPPQGFLADATRHLLAVGFMIGMICAMGFRFVPVIEGVCLALPGARAVAFWALTLAVLLRTVELGAGCLHEGLLRLAAISGFLAWVALWAFGLAVGLTMLRGAALRRGHPGSIG